MSIVEGSSSVVGEFYPYRPEQVWAVLNSRQLILADWGLDSEEPILEVGRGFVIKVWPIPGTRFRGVLECKYLEVRPHELLVFTLTSIGNKPWVLYGTQSLVPQGRGTYVTYTVEGFSPGRLDHAIARRVIHGGHQLVLRRLSKILAQQHIAS